MGWSLCPLLFPLTMVTRVLQQLCASPHRAEHRPGLGVLAEGGARGRGQWQARWSLGARDVSQQVSNMHVGPNILRLHLPSKSHTRISLAGPPVMGCVVSPQRIR